jgi:hypothetical protein
VISDQVGVVDFPTLGDLIDGLDRAALPVPDGFSAAAVPPVRLAVLVHREPLPDPRGREVDPGAAAAEPGVRLPPLADRRPAEDGKGPWTACFVASRRSARRCSAGGPKPRRVYVCEDNGCECGWEYEYEPGEPKGIRHPSPLIQITATSEDQADNIYRPLKAMIRLGPLKELLIRPRGLHPDPRRARGRPGPGPHRRRHRVGELPLGNPISHAEQDETGLYTKSNKMRKVAETQRRGAAGMGGRTMETTNAWDPARTRYAQTTYESAREDVFRFYRNPDPSPSAARRGRQAALVPNKANRRKIHAFVYEGSWWVNLDSIEAEAARWPRPTPRRPSGSSGTGSSSGRRLVAAGRACGTAGERVPVAA